MGLLLVAGASTVFASFCSLLGLLLHSRAFVVFVSHEAPAPSAPPLRRLRKTLRPVTGHNGRREQIQDVPTVITVVGSRFSPSVRPHRRCIINICYSTFVACYLSISDGSACHILWSTHRGMKFLQHGVAEALRTNHLCADDNNDDGNCTGNDGRLPYPYGSTVKCNYNETLHCMLTFERL